MGFSSWDCVLGNQNCRIHRGKWAEPARSQKSLCVMTIGILSPKPYQIIVVTYFYRLTYLPFLGYTVEPCFRHLFLGTASRVQVIHSLSSLKGGYVRDYMALGYIIIRSPYTPYSICLRGTIVLAMPGLWPPPCSGPPQWPPRRAQPMSVGALGEDRGEASEESIRPSGLEFGKYVIS